MFFTHIVLLIKCHSMAQLNYLIQLGVIYNAEILHLPK